MEIYTSQFRYSGEDRLDITVKTGNLAFAPSWDIVMGHKRGEITDEEYIDVYLDILINSYHHNKEEWEKLLVKDRITLVCYCKAGAFCHRVVMANFLQDAFYGVKYMGEI